MDIAPAQWDSPIGRTKVCRGKLRSLTKASGAVGRSRHSQGEVFASGEAPQPAATALPVGAAIEAV